MSRGVSPPGTAAVGAVVVGAVRFRSVRAAALSYAARSHLRPLLLCPRPRPQLQPSSIQHHAVPATPNPPPVPQPSPQPRVAHIRNAVHHRPARRGGPVREHLNVLGRYPIAGREERRVHVVLVVIVVVFRLEHCLSAMPRSCELRVRWATRDIARTLVPETTGMPTLVATTATWHLATITAPCSMTTATRHSHTVSPRILSNRWSGSGLSRCDEPPRDDVRDSAWWGATDGGRVGGRLGGRDDRRDEDALPESTCVGSRG